jgi:hypothetical protein
VSLGQRLASVKRFAEQIKAALPQRGEKWSLRSKLFELARRLKDECRDLAADTLDVIANEWYAGAEWAMGETDVADVRALLKNAFVKARRGFTEPSRQKEAIASEYQRLKNEPLSETAKRFKNPINREAVRAFEAAQRVNPNGDFELGETFLAKLIGCSQPRAGRAIDTLEYDGVIAMTAERIKNKVARRWRLIATVKTVAERAAEKIRATLAAAWKLAARLVGKVTATSEPSEPGEPAEPQAEPTERAWWESDPEQAPYVPPAVQAPSGARRDRDGPRPKRASGWRQRSWREIVFGMCRPRPNRHSEPNPTRPTANGAVGS